MKKFKLFLQRFYKCECDFMKEFLFNMKKRFKKIYWEALPDKTFLKKKYKIKTGRILNLRNPITFTEKINWLKLYNRDPKYTMMVDKYRVREYVTSTIGEQHLIPLVGAWDNVEDIDFSKLPNEFVLKCNHDKGVIICKDKNKADLEKIRKEIEFHYNRDFYKAGREWAYKNVKRKIICEKFISDEDGNGLKDYKFFCFGGTVRAIFVVTSREKNIVGKYYDDAFNPLPITYKGVTCGEQIELPKNFEEMKSIAIDLAKDIPFVRVDLYNIKGKIYFGELTFYPNAGFMPLKPEQWEVQFGKWINLPRKKS